MIQIDLGKLSVTNRNKTENVIKVLSDALELNILNNSWNRHLIFSKDAFGIERREVFMLVKCIFGAEVVVEGEGSPNQTSDIIFEILKPEPILSAREEVRNNQKKLTEDLKVDTKKLITNKGEIFYYKGKELKLQERYDYVKAFFILYENVDEEGYCSYKGYQKGYKKKYPNDYKKRPQNLRDFTTWAQKMLTEKKNGFLRKVGNDELIESRRGEGFVFKNMKS